MTGLKGASVQLSSSKDRILKMKNTLMEKEMCTSELQNELHSLRKQMKKFTQEKVKTTHSLQKKLCVLRHKGKECNGNRPSIIKVRFQAITAQNKNFQKQRISTVCEGFPEERE
jgi:septation ring formation regulator EzrA